MGGARNRANTPLNPDAARTFADEWIECWNSHDLDRILSHYADDICFHSPRAQLVTGTSPVNGKPALRAYWSKALSQSPDLEFSLIEYFLGVDCLSVHYVNHRDQRVIETFVFGEQGLVTESIACYQRPDNS